MPGRVPHWSLHHLSPVVFPNTDFNISLPCQENMILTFILCSLLRLPVLPRCSSHASSGYPPLVLQDCPGSSSFVFNELIYFWLHWVFIALWLSFGCREQELLSSWGMQASRCGGFSCCGVWASGHMGSSSCGPWALEHRLSSCGAWA